MSIFFPARRATRKVGLIITAAGSSSRFSTGKKKEYQLLSDGTAVINRVITNFIAAADFSPLVVTVPEGQEEAVKRLIDRCPVDSALLSQGIDEAARHFRQKEAIEVIPGGRTRQESVFLALQHLEPFNPDLVLIHDGARPWVSVTLIRETIKFTALYGAAAPVLPSEEALTEVDPEGFILSHPPREKIFRLQTPQGFRFKEILTAHRKAEKKGLSAFDDTQLYKSSVGKVFTFPGERLNKKITYLEDLV